MAWKLRTGRYSEPELALVELAVRPGDTVVDVGANFGLFAYPLARRVGPDGAVIAYEALPQTFAELERILRRLKAERVTLRPVAVGEAPGTVALSVPREADGRVRAGEVAIGGDGDASADVPVVRLDDDVPGGAEVTFLKCDVEGADLLVLRGAAALLERCAPTILVEVAPRLLARHGHTAGEVHAFLKDLGYALFRFEDGRLVADDAVVDANLVAVHPRLRGRLDL